MSQSMQRLDPGKYTINIGGTVYNVNKEEQRVATGRSKRGTVKQVWVARRDDGYVLESSTRYRDAKNAVFADSELPPNQRPVASVTDSQTHDDGTEQPSLFEGQDEAVVAPSVAVPEQPVTESPAFVQHVEEPAPVVTDDDIPEPEHEQDNSGQTTFSWAG